MKIVKRGELPKPPECGYWKCARCGTVFEIEEGDELAPDVRYEDHQRDGELLFGYYCPVCLDAVIGKTRPPRDEVPA